MKVLIALAIIAAASAAVPSAVRLPAPALPALETAELLNEVVPSAVKIVEEPVANADLVVASENEVAPTSVKIVDSADDVAKETVVAESEVAPTSVKIVDTAEEQLTVAAEREAAPTSVKVVDTAEELAVSDNDLPTAVKVVDVADNEVVPTAVKTVASAEDVSVLSVSSDSEVAPDAVHVVDVPLDSVKIVELPALTEEQLAEINAIPAFQAEGIKFADMRPLIIPQEILRQIQMMSPLAVNADVEGAEVSPFAYVGAKQVVPSPVNIVEAPENPRTIPREWLRN